jgi:hypothetical protein
MLHSYNAEHKEAKDGIPACEAAEDSLAAIYPDDQVECYFYNVGN